MYRVFTVSTKTWGDRVELDVISAPWGGAMNAGTSGSVTLNLADPGVAEVAGLNDLYPGTRCIVIEYAGVVLDAGIIWEADYDRDTMKLSVSYEHPVWSLLALRLISEIRDQNIVTWKKIYTGLSYRTMVKRLVTLATTGTARTLPLVLPADVAGSVSRTYYGYNTDVALDAIREIMDQDTGPDVDFRPRWKSDGTLEFVMRCGDLTAGTVEVDFTADDPGARGLGIKTSARELATQVFAVGEGSGLKMKVRESQSANIADYPQMEHIEQFKNIKDTADLYQAAASELVSRNGTVRQLRCELDLRSDAWDVSMLQPGMVLRWYIRDDPYFVNGWREWEVLKYSGDSNTHWVKLEFFEKGG